MSEVTISEVLEDLKKLECVFVAFTDHVIPDVLATIPEEDDALRQQISTAIDLSDMLFRRIRARIDSKTTMDLD